MAKEEGIVTKIGINTAWVKTTRTSACEGCSAKSSCHALGGVNEMEVEAINAAGAQVNDRIVLSLKTSSLLKATFLLYMFPILCMIAGAVIGHHLSQVFNFNESILPAIFGFSCFVLALMFIRSKGKKMAQNDQYKPKIIRILQKGDRKAFAPDHTKSNL